MMELAMTLCPICHDPYGVVVLAEHITTKHEKVWNDPDEMRMRRNGSKHAEFTRKE